MNKKTLWITETAVMIALLVALQWATKPLGQFVTGSCVNLVLGYRRCGWPGGLTVALVGPFFAFLLGISPAFPIVPWWPSATWCWWYPAPSQPGQDRCTQLSPWL
ncbi:MAG: hypothetical protein ACLTGT_02910 [Oscillospiraceae bacterium]